MKSLCAVLIVAAACGDRAPVYLDTLSQGFCDPGICGDVTTADVTLYVSSAGDNSNACTEAEPCESVEGALGHVPNNIQHLVKVHVAAGDFKGANLGWYNVVPRTDGGTGLLIEGTFGAPTITGPTSGTVYAAVAGSGATWGSIDVPDAGWTANQLQGDYLEITDGPGSGQVFPIDSNTDSRINIVGPFASPAPNNTSSFAIQESKTNITVPASLSSSPLDAAIPLAGFIFSGDSSNAAARSIIVRRMNFPASVSFIGAYFGYGWSTASIEETRYRGSADFLGVVHANYVRFQKNILQGTAAVSDMMETYIMSSIGTVQWNNNVMFSGKNLAVVTGVGYFNATHNAARGGLRSVNMGAVTEGRILYLKATNLGGNCIDSNVAATDSTLGSWYIQDSLLENCGGDGIYVLGGPNMIALQNVTGTGNGGYGIQAKEGAWIRVTSGTSVTGTSGDIRLDSTTYAYSYLRAQTPKIVTDPLHFSKIFER